MKTVCVLVCLAAVAAGSPTWPWTRPGGSATGGASANAVQGISNGGSISQVGVSAGGSASNGGSSHNRGTAGLSSSSGFFGNTNRAQTSAVSNQSGGRPYYNRYG